MKKKTKGYADVLIGLQYGDEGKAKVIDLIADNYDVIARFNGGANAGHTLKTNKGKIALHQIPSGIFYDKKILYIGSGCVVDLVKLVKELAEVKKLGITLTGRLHISDQASLVQPHHILIDTLTTSEIGTTKNGIGPAYADKAMRMTGTRLLNIKLGDLLDDNSLIQQIQKNLETTIEEYQVKNFPISQTLQALTDALKQLTPFIERDTLFLQKLVEKGRKVLFEGAQSVMLDVTRGSIPYVTSSNTVAGAAYVGGDVSPKFHRKTIGVAKAIMSRVGNGPFASEYGETASEIYCMQEDGVKHNQDFEQKTYDPKKLLMSDNPFEMGIALRMIGNEYGTVTKRPRRIGMLDLVQLRYTISMNGVDELFLNKCDLLVDFAQTKQKTIPVVTGYSLDKKSIDYVPGSNSAYRKVVTTVTQFPSFHQTTDRIKSTKALPKALHTLLKTIETTTDVKLLAIGTGPARQDYILL